MANVTTTVAQYFIPEIWAQVALEVLRSQVVLAGIVARDTDITQNFNVGDILHIPYPGTFVANDKAANTAVTLQVPSNSADLQVTLDKHKEVSFIVEDIAQAQANQDLMKTYISAAIPPLAEALEKDLYTAASGLTSIIGTAGTDLTAAMVRSTRKTLNVNKVPVKEPRFLVVSPKDEVALMGDSTLQSFYAFAQSQTVEGGKAPVLYGMEAQMSQLTPIGALITLGSQASGTFTVTYAGQTTSALQYNAAAATVQTALEALSTIGTGNVAVTGGTGGPYTVRLKGTKGGETTSFTATFSSLATPANASIVDATVNLALHKNALILAMRTMPEPPAGVGVQTATVVDPISKLALRIIYSYNPSYLGMQITIDILYGVKVMRATHGVITLS